MWYGKIWCTYVRRHDQPVGQTRKIPPFIRLWHNLWPIRRILAEFDPKIERWTILNDPFARIWRHHSQCENVWAKFQVFPHDWWDTGCSVPGGPAPAKQIACVHGLIWRVGSDLARHLVRSLILEPWIFPVSYGFFIGVPSFSHGFPMVFPGISLYHTGSNFSWVIWGWVHPRLTSGNDSHSTHSYGKSPCLIGTFTRKIVIFNSYVTTSRAMENDLFSWENSL